MAMRLLQPMALQLGSQPRHRPACLDVRSCVASLAAAAARGGASD
jgi:hypothetical protein